MKQVRIVGGAAPVASESTVLPSKVSSGLTGLQISASRASAPELPEPVGAEQAEDVPDLEGLTED